VAWWQQRIDADNSMVDDHHPAPRYDIRRAPVEGANDQPHRRVPTRRSTTRRWRRISTSPRHRALRRPNVGRLTVEDNVELAAARGTTDADGNTCDGTLRSTDRCRGQIGWRDHRGGTRTQTQGQGAGFGGAGAGMRRRRRRGSGAVGGESYQSKTIRCTDVGSIGGQGSDPHRAAGGARWSSTLRTRSASTARSSSPGEPGPV